METEFDNRVHIAIEKVEHEAWLDLFAAAADNGVQLTQASYMRQGTNIMLADPVTPIFEFNRVLG